MGRGWGHRAAVQAEPYLSCMSNLALYCLLAHGWQPCHLQVPWRWAGDARMSRGRLCFSITCTTCLVQILAWLAPQLVCLSTHRGRPH